ncbi:MAG: proteasome assembly chaperone family protein [Candidatus Hydrothermarchaeota archaeon]
MKEAIVKIYVEPKLENPILIEGLPGIGHVGKLAAEHMINEIDAKKFADLFSPDFPPQILVKEDGTIKLMSNEFYFYKGKGSHPDLIFVVGNTQGLTSQGQYDIVSKILDVVEKYNTKQIFTLGGYGTGRIVKKPRVFGATTDLSLIKEMEKYGIDFETEDERGGIVGTSGLLLGVGELRGMNGVCLMGETSGYLVDAKSAKAVLEVLTKILKIEIDLDELENRAKEAEKTLPRIYEMQKKALEAAHKDIDVDEDLRYIG